MYPLNSMGVEDLLKKGQIERSIMQGIEDAEADLKIKIHNKGELLKKLYNYYLFVIDGGENVMDAKEIKKFSDEDYREITNFFYIAEDSQKDYTLDALVEATYISARVPYDKSKKIVEKFHNNRAYIFHMSFKSAKYGLEPYEMHKLAYAIGYTAGVTYAIEKFSPIHLPYLNDMVKILGVKSKFKKKELD